MRGVERHLSAVLNRRTPASSPYVPATKAQKGWPYWYSLKRGLDCSSADRREVVAQDRVAHPHRRERVLAADGVVLRHALDDEERQADELLERAAPLRDVVLELVDQLVAQHVVGLGVRARHRQHHALAKPLGHALRALADVGDVGLPEVGVVGVEDDRLPLVELVLQNGARAVYQRSAMRPTSRAACSSSA